MIIVLNVLTEHSDSVGGRNPVGGAVAGSLARDHGHLLAGRYDDGRVGFRCPAGLRGGRFDGFRVAVLHRVVVQHPSDGRRGVAAGRLAAHRHRLLRSRFRRPFNDHVARAVCARTCGHINIRTLHCCVVGTFDFRKLTMNMIFFGFFCSRLPVPGLKTNGGNKQNKNKQNNNTDRSFRFF